MERRNAVYLVDTILGLYYIHLLPEFFANNLHFIKRDNIINTAYAEAYFNKVYLQNSITVIPLHSFTRDTIFRRSVRRLSS